MGSVAGSRLSLVNIKRSSVTPVSGPHMRPPFDRSSIVAMGSTVSQTYLSFATSRTAGVAI